MSLLSRVSRPEYLFRPTQVWRRLALAVRPPAGRTVVRLPWGLPLAVDPSDAIGRSVLATGVYDLALTEVLWRLTAPDDLAVDAGANIGYTASVLAARGGRVHAVEPHPRVFADLEANTARWKGRASPVALHQLALSSSAGSAVLVEGDAFSAGNRGTAALAADRTAGGQPVVTARLDDLLPDGTIGVLKLDVEGHEAALLAGASGRLAARTVRDVVFEDLGGYPSDSSGRLERAGYTVYRIRGTLWGPRLAPAGSVEPEDAAHPPNFLATIDASRARRLLAPRGWRSLRGN